MKNKILLTTGLLAIFLAILVLPVISASTMVVTMHAPLNDSNHSSTVVVNCSVADPYDVLNMTFNVTNAAGTNYTLGTMVNSTPNQSAWSTTLTVPATIADGINYNFTCTADNASDQIDASVVTSNIIIDGTDPVCTLIGDHTTIPWKGNIMVEWTTYDAIGLSSTAVTIDGPQDQTTASYTDTNRTVYLGSQDTNYVGDWIVTITGTDGSANTCSETYEFKSYLPDGEIWEPAPTKPKDTGKILLGLLAVAAIVYFAFIKKK